MTCRCGCGRALFGSRRQWCPDAMKARARAAYAASKARHADPATAPRCVVCRTREAGRGQVCQVCRDTGDLPTHEIEAIIAAAEAWHTYQRRHP
jgi:hypothetical protein